MAQLFLRFRQCIFFIFHSKLFFNWTFFIILVYFYFPLLNLWICTQNWRYKNLFWIIHWRNECSQTNLSIWLVLFYWYYQLLGIFSILIIIIIRTAMLLAKNATDQQKLIVSLVQRTNIFQDQEQTVIIMKTNLIVK